MTIKLVFKNKKYLIQFEPDNTLEELYNIASEISGLNSDNITLVHSGFKLPFVKDAVKLFGISSNSSVLCLPLKRKQEHHKPRPSSAENVETKKEAAPSLTSLSKRAAELGIPDLANLPPFETSFTAFHPPSKCKPEERKQMEALARLLATEHVKIEPIIREYLNLAVTFLDPEPTSQKPAEKQLQDAYARASELLLQSLLKIDAVQAPEGSQLIRHKRKEAVQLIQSWLKVVDGIKARLKTHSTETSINKHHHKNHGNDQYRHH